MIKYVVLFLLISTSSVWASTLESSAHVWDTWTYSFKLKNGKIFNTSKYDCHREVNKRTGKPDLPKPTNCVNTEEEARYQSQKEADNFEKGNPL